MRPPRCAECRRQCGSSERQDETAAFTSGGSSATPGDSQRLACLHDASSLPLPLRCLQVRWPTRPQHPPAPVRALRYHNDHSPSPGGTGGARFDAGDAALLEARLADLRRQALEEEYRRPPNPGLQATDFVAQLLRALWNNSDPRPDSGFRLLLRASTKEWRRKLYTAVAAPDGAREEVVASAVGEAMARPRNQYGILVGEEEEYYATFPTDVLDYGDGKCWVECRLRNKQDDALLAILGWELERRESDGAWLVGSIDWQDFRACYRPGIGREEWMRICG